MASNDFNLGLMSSALNTVMLLYNSVLSCFNEGLMHVTSAELTPWPKKYKINDQQLLEIFLYKYTLWLLDTSLTRAIQIDSLRIQCSKRNVLRHHPS